MAVESTPSTEKYIILNIAQGFDSVGDYVESMVIDKITTSGTLVKEVRPSIPSNYLINLITLVKFPPYK